MSGTAKRSAPSTKKRTSRAEPERELPKGPGRGPVQTKRTAEFDGSFGCDAAGPKGPNERALGEPARGAACDARPFLAAAPQGPRAKCARPKIGAPPAEPARPECARQIAALDPALRPRMKASLSGKTLPLPYTFQKLRSCIQGRDWFRSVRTFSAETSGATSPESAPRRRVWQRKTSETRGTSSSAPQRRPSAASSSSAAV